MITIDLERNPQLEFRIDSFQVPEAARPEFEEAMRRNLAFLHTLSGFLGHLAFVKTGGPTTFDVTTIAVWQDHQAIEAAGAQVREYYRRIGFDPAAAMTRWGVRAEIGSFRAPPELQR